MRSVLVRPHRVLETRGARAILGRTVTLSDVVWQQANLAGFVAGCFTADLPLIAASLEDVLIEPQRKGLIPGFQAVKDAAMSRGALGCSISGAGPTMFAWAEEVKADEVRAAMVDAFRAEGITSDAWITRIEPVGASIVNGPMRFVSTRGGTAPVTLSDAIRQGIAADGGLFVPDRLPALSWSDFPPVGLASDPRRAS